MRHEFIRELIEVRLDLDQALGLAANPLNAVAGGLQGSAGAFNGDGTGNFGFGINCVIASNCNGTSAPTGIPDSCCMYTNRPYLVKTDLPNPRRLEGCLG